MTTKEQIQDLLVNHGLFPNQAEEVMPAVMEALDKLDPSYSITWIVLLTNIQT